MINIYKNFLSEESINQLDEKIENILYKSDPDVPHFTTSLTSWSKYLQNNSTPIVRYVLNKNDDTIFQLLKKP